MSQKTIVSAIVRRFQQLLLIKEARIAFSLIRYVIYRYIIRNVKIYSEPEDGLGKNTLKYNYEKILHSVFKHERVQHIIRPLVAIEDINHRLPYLKTLSIGPRSESELLLISAYGFSWNNIRGLDLFSYCPRIDVGDMHAMPYADNNFDVVFLGWVLSYSDEREKALNEIVRVLRSGGYICLGQGYDSTCENGEVQGGYVGAKYRPNSIDGFLAPIKENIDTIFFRHDITAEMVKKGQRAILAVFSIKK